MSKKKINFYIDGFNIYHRIDEYYRKTHKCYKWLNYRSLFNSLIKSDEEINKIYFFTAVSKEFFSLEQIERHGIYIDALKTVGIEIIKGNWKSNSKYYKLNEQCTLKVKVRNEKETDIKIAMQMLKDAYLLKDDELNKIYLMSGDSDFSPIIEDIRKNTRKLVGIVTHPFHKGIVPLNNIDSLRNNCSDKMVIELHFDQLKGHSFNKEIPINNSEVIIKMPESYEVF